MSLTYNVFRPMHRAEQYLGQSGHEIGGLALNPMALQMIAEAKTAGRRPSGVWVDGEWVRVQDGKRWLSLRIEPPADSGRESSPGWREQMR